MAHHTTHRFEIRVKGWLTDLFCARFDLVPPIQLEDGDTILRGEVQDQSALFGVLHSIESLGLTVVSVKTFPDDQPPVDGSQH